LIESQIDWSSKRVRKRTGHSDILFLSPAKILERVGKDMPEFDIRKQGVKIGDRLEKAKEYLKNVMNNPEFDTVEGTNVYLEWWKYDNNGERVEFEYLGKVIRLARKLNDKDAKLLFNVITKKVEDRKRKINS
jgi:hypothetical protein